MTPAFSAKVVALPDIPSRSESWPISSGIDISAGKAVVPPSAVVRARVPDTATWPWPIPLGIAVILAVIDAPGSVVEDDIDWRTDLDGLKAIL